MRLSEAVKNIEGTLTGDTEFIGGEYDSRNVKKGNLFVCIKGEKTDGHMYTKKADENGASAVICAHEVDTSLPCFITDDPLAAFQRIASYYKSTLSIKTAAVTGSVGKTTTKEFVSAVLSGKFRLSKTEGNRNSCIGLPATLLGIDKNAEAAVLEMGMSNFGEISLLSKMAKPDIAVITNIGYSHIEFLGSRENILRAKLEIAEGMDENGILLLNSDDQIISQYDSSKLKCRVLRYALGDKKADFRAVDVVPGESTVFTALTPNGEFEVSLPVEGLHNVYNALAAVAVGQLFGLDENEIITGLKSFKNAPMRQNIFTQNGITYIDDCYNASPTSVRAALDILHSKAGRRIAVLGDMLELGNESERLHKMTGNCLRSDDLLIAFGKFAEAYAVGAAEAGVPLKNIFTCETTEKAADILSEIKNEGDVILVKASRGMQAEKIIQNETTKQQ